MMHHSKSDGFSLVELSIVLVILGLLVGGILAGQSLIRAAELRSITTSVDKYKIAVMAFRDKYMQLPGDITNATSFWGDRATGTESCADAAITDGSPGTCNGNGDQKIGDTSDLSQLVEYALSWQHLTLAGLVEGTYTGISYNLLRNVNVPAARVGQGVYWLVYTRTYGRYGNMIILGSVTGQAWGPVIKPQEAWNIDTKLDDGNPFRGQVRTWNGYNSGAFPTTGCVATGDAFSSAAVTYTLTATDNSCAMTFFMPF